MGDLGLVLQIKTTYGGFLKRPQSSFNTLTQIEKTVLRKCHIKKVT